MSDFISIDDQFDLTKRYYNPKIFIFLAPLFSFILPGVLFGINVYNSKGKKRGIQSLAFVLLSGICFFITVILLGNYFQKFIGGNSKYFFEAINIGIGALLYDKQRKQFKTWLTLGGKPKNILPPVLISVVPVALLVWAALANQFVNTELFEYGNNDIYYSKEINGNEVEKIVNAFLTTRIMNEKSEMLLIIKKHTNEYWFLIPIKKDAINRTETMKMLNSIEIVLNTNSNISKEIKVIQMNEKFKIVNRK